MADALEKGQVRARDASRVFRLNVVKERSLKEVILRRQLPPKRQLWALRDVDLDIEPGETFGIVGQNGSGKSTLLRLIAGAAYPTEGEIAVRGRIAPLLALGAGFQPDMTGRECVQINATALGLSKQEIAERLDEIVRFAEIPDFIDTPVRYYSSGMLARLGFSVAVHTDPDLLLVDEVLAVGDHAFQEKCIARIEQLRTDGVTIFFVSHDDSTIKRLCDRVLWLKDGRMAADGAAAEVLAAYEGR